MSRRLELVVTPELAGVKVDTLLKRHLHLSGTVVRRVKWLEDGILVDGLRVNTRFCPAAGQVLLDVNYRCHGQIVQKSLQVIEANRNRFPKTIHAEHSFIRDCPGGVLDQKALRTPT